MNPDGTLTGFLLHGVVSAVAILITAKLVSGFRIGGFFSAFAAALVIGVANAVLWPLFFFLTLPINVLTLGLFTFVINGAILKICAAVLPGFDIESWGAAIFGAIVLALLGLVLHGILI